MLMLYEYMNNGNCNYFYFKIILYRIPVTVTRTHTLFVKCLLFMCHNVFVTC